MENCSEKKVPARRQFPQQTFHETGWSNSTVGRVLASNAAELVPSCGPPGMILERRTRSNPEYCSPNANNYIPKQRTASGLER